jgi:malonyl-ACP O-methyltransferase BioC
MTFCETINLTRPQRTASMLPVLFLPGWGFDGRITELIGPAARAWISSPTMLDPATLVSDLAAFLERAGIERIKLIGWSMGANLALDFARTHPGRVAALDLVAMRRSWPADEIGAIAAELRADPVRLLQTFYRKCFLGHKAAYRIFVKSLQDDSIRRADTELLGKGLEYLRRARAIPAPGIPTRLVHGRNDLIAPLDQRAELPGATVDLIEHGGHLPFLLPSFFRQDRERKDVIRRRFSRAAATYDEHARLQMELTDELAAVLSRLPATDRLQRILEIGCGTGSYTGLLAGRFPQAEIVALDFSPPMIRAAAAKMADRPGLRLVCVDGEKFLAGGQGEEPFDLITSNATLQWFTDLKRSLGNIAGRLPPGGELLATIFGPQTLRELSLGLAAIFGRDIGLAAHAFPDYEELRTLLTGLFDQVHMERKIIHRHYPGSLDLLLQIKKTGTGGWQTGKGPVFTRSSLRSLDYWFTEHYGGCRVSYEIFLVQCRK